MTIGSIRYAPAVPGGRPRMTVLAAELYDTWLTPNGVDGWLAATATIRVEDDRITFPSWRHLDGTLGGWGHDIMTVREWRQCSPLSAVEIPRPRGTVLLGEDHDLVAVLRTRPLVLPVTNRVRHLFDLSGLILAER